MTNDLPTRLRRHSHTEYPMGDGQIFRLKMPLLSEAADEIERLRSECEKWKNLTELAYQSWVSDSWLEFVEQFDEAVRGE